MPEVTTDEMGKVKAGFAVCTVNPELVADTLLPDALHTHNQAALEYFLTIQEQADARLGKCLMLFSLHCSLVDVYVDGMGHPAGSAKQQVKLLSFLKVEEGNPFYVLPVVSEPLFPQFKGPKTPGVVRTQRQRGTLVFFFAFIVRFLIVQVAWCIGRIPLNPGRFFHHRSVRFTDACSFVANRLSSDENEPSVPDRVLFSKLADPKGRYTLLKATQAYLRYEMCVPLVFTDGGDIVVPSNYEEMIPDGTLVAVRGKMKM